MKLINLKNNLGEPINGPVLIEPEVFKDSRGFFYESWNKKKFNEIINEEINFAQDNISKSFKGVLRGLHYQLPPNVQGKLVRCSLGKIFDVAVDLRKSSSTFSTWVSVELSSVNKKIFWVPPGFAHGFLTISNFAEVNYKTTSFWSSISERSLIWNDKDINIKWPTDKIKKTNIFLSKKDNNAMTLKESIEKKEIFK